MKSAAAAVEQSALLDQREPQMLAMQPAGDGVVSMFERLASNPDTKIENLERLMALWERNEAKRAEGAFNAAMSAAQKEMRPVAADAWNPQTKSNYASYKALDNALRPIYTDHGFGLSFNTGDAPLPDYVRVLCYVTHDGGHSREYHVDMPADGKGAKGGDVMTKTHAVGSGLSYGQRYLLKMVFNVAVGEDDDDGNRATATAKATPETKAPAGYQDWWTDIQAVADNGYGPFSTAWNNSKEEHRAYAMHTSRDVLSRLKQKAKAVDAKAAAVKS